MKCPYCKAGELKPAKKPGYCCCHRCGFLYTDNVQDDPDLTKYKYDVASIRSKDGEPSAVFQKARGKFNDGKWKVVGNWLVKGNFSLLFGQKFLILKRRAK